MWDAYDATKQKQTLNTTGWNFNKDSKIEVFHWQLWIRYCSNIRWEKIPERKLWKSENANLKLPFNRDVKVSWLRSTVQKHKHLLKQIAAAEVGISWRINQNLLKRNYRLAWTRWVVGGTANFLRSCLHAMVWGLLDFEFQLPHTKSEHFSAQFQPEESIDESSH